MLSEAQKFWDAISGKVRQLVRGETQNTMRCERYDVTTAPNGTVVGVMKPYGSNEIFLPYSAEISTASVGDPVLVVWWGSMSNAKVYYFADGFRGSREQAVNIQTYGISTGYKRIVTIPQSSRHIFFCVGNALTNRSFAYVTRTASGTSPNLTEIYSTSNVELTTQASGTVTISNTASAALTLVIMTVQGSAPAVGDIAPN